MSAGLLSVRGLTVTFPGPNGERLPVVDGVSFDIGRGEIAALVGESGSGKSVTALALLDLVPEPGAVEAGEVLFDGRDVRSLPEAEKRRVRGGGIGLVFQEPGAALDPVRTIGSELVDVIRRHRGTSRRQARAEALAWLSRVALPEPERRMEDVPHRMSGGMRQRAMLALALAGGPRLLVADEPTTALDVTIQAQLLALLRRLREELSLTVLVITHDLGVVAELADRALVMYAGEIVEEAPVADLFARPAHPYTRALLAARPGLSEGRGRRLPAIEGTVPEPGKRPAGCAFAPRCGEAFGRCAAARPSLSPLAGRPGLAACFLWQGEGREP
ncbi:ABC transporter ATP-binding protein [Acidobacteria bacterium ACD]|nr:MAG: ABC transporter ATP-binding protein [Acidobacteriota bacterium]MCE7958869.1 ABC transporter ATP-binding protein [Acidobacteria bacterium ACB2]MDL1948780.1 ABC transporter ATP-binding protein [Acidobacteria bacterium ACD]